MSIKYFTLSKLFTKGTNSLIILDDCAGSQDVKNRTSELVKLTFSARHYGLSTIVITQQLTSIAKPYRENISKAFVFHTPNKNTTKTIFDEFLDVSREEETSLKNKLKNTKYATLEINLRYPFDYKINTPQK